MAVVGEEYNVKERERGSNIKWGIGEGDGNFGEENQDMKNGCGEEYQVVIHVHICVLVYTLTN